MTLRTLIFNSLRHRWRAHLGVVLGAAVGSAALIGALIVGDSVRESLRQRALERLAGVQLAATTGDRFFGSDLLNRMVTLSSNEWRKTARILPDGQPLFQFQEGQVVWPWPTVAKGFAVLQLPATVARQDGAARANTVQVYGVSAEFFSSRMTHTTDSVWLNQALAQQLNAGPGDQLVLRIQKPSAMSRESTLVSLNESTVALRLHVAGVLTTAPGDFSLRAGSVPPLNAFVRLDQLGKSTGLDGKANLLLAQAASIAHPSGQAEETLRRFAFFGRGTGIGTIGNPADSAQTFGIVERLLTNSWSLTDVSLGLRLVTNGNSADPHTDGVPMLDLTTSRVFLDAAVIRAVSAIRPNSQPILTFLVNQFRAGTNATPYSMVTAAGAPWTPPDMKDDEIVLSQWLADDLQVKPGEMVDLTSFLPDSAAKLIEATNRFRVRSIVPMQMPWADRTLMPEFPGLAKAESTHDWDAGFPLVHRIREKDEAYWKQYRGTPKAFVTLAAGQKMWANRFGELTAIRFPAPTNQVAEYRAALERSILAELKPEDVGLRFEPVRDQALAAASQSQDFGGLFIGFSFFLIAAALILMGLLFQFGMEQRSVEVGTLLALGFTPRQVRKLFLLEGCALAVIGSVTGAAGGIVYARLMLRGLTTVWRDAVGTASLGFHITPLTLIVGLTTAVAVSALTIWLVLRKQARQPARELLAGEGVEDGSSEPQRCNNGKGETPKNFCVVCVSAVLSCCRKFSMPASASSSRALIVGTIASLAAIGLVAWAMAKGDTANAEIFFSAGALLLIAGLAFVGAWLRWLGGVEARRAFTLGSLGVRGCTRRRKRSLAVAALLACGVFIIASIGVFRLDANADAWKRSSGTGGFALIGQSTMPVVKDLNSPEGRDFFGLEEKDLVGVSVVPFRVREGDEASCLNLNRAQKPRLLGVRPELLAARRAFTFAGVAKELPATSGWMLLKGATSEFRLQAVPASAPPEGGTLAEVPAIGDAASIQWALGKKIGDTIDYTDERGRVFKLRLVGAVANSILQGNLVIDEAEFVKRFPSEAGYRAFLIDAPSNRLVQVSATLSRGLQDVGLELTPAAQRLAQFNAVQNTYLNTFQVLGGLGLLLGSAGLGVVVLRNVLERRAELALLLAVGFRPRQLRWLVLGEHGVLLALGLAVGVAAASLAVLPTVWSPSASLPWRSLGLTLGGVFLTGLGAAWMATWLALRGQLLEALRSE